jgi:pimeloyl-ACP methyl ester carboxylesterase
VDGLALRARYVSSRNGAAVIVFPGSASRAPQARVLVRHGYGVLMLDMRGYGQSDGDPNAFGWGATKDVDAGVAFLKRRDDVKTGRIGGLGFSVGGELLLEAAAGNPALRAVVSEGAGERSVRETLTRGVRAVLVLPMEAATTAAVAVLSGDLPPPSLPHVVARIAPRQIMLIYAGRGTGGEDLQPSYYAAAGQPKTLWRIAEARHTGGLAARPRAYERRVIAFFDQALLARQPERLAGTTSARLTSAREARRWNPSTKVLVSSTSARARPVPSVSGGSSACSRSAAHSCPSSISTPCSSACSRPRGK